MPENETLVYDTRSASRWNPVRERMDGGQAPADLFPEIQHQFYAALQKVWRQWRERGVDAAQLFDAALIDRSALRGLIKKLSFDRNAQLVRDIAAGRQDADMEYLIGDFVNAAWEDVETRLGLDRRYESQSLEFTGQVQRMLSRIARCLINNPSRIPNRPSRNEPPPDLDTQLGESLL
jgi:hypothetical protein